MYIHIYNVHISKRTWNRGDMQAIPGYKTENELVTPGSGPTRRRLYFWAAGAPYSSRETEHPAKENAQIVGSACATYERTKLCC